MSSEDLNQPAHLRSLISLRCLHEETLHFGYPKGANAQADLNLCWARMSEGTFSNVAANFEKARKSVGI